jgi:hypothetical protein
MNLPFLSRNTISGWIREFGSSGSVSGTSLGATRTVPAEETVDTVRNLFNVVHGALLVSNPLAQAHPEGVWDGRSIT